MNEEYFQKINDLYSEYYSLLSKENMENKLQVLKNKIIIEVCHVFYLPNRTSSHRMTTYESKIKRANEAYSDEIVVKIVECLDFFSRKNCAMDDRPKQKNTIQERNFSKYVYTSVKKRLGYLKAHAQVKEDTFMEIPREKIDLIKIIKKEDQNLSKLIKNPEKRANYIKLKLGISDDDFKILYPLVMEKHVSLDTPVTGDNDGNTTLLDLQSSKIISVQDVIEKEETLKQFLDNVQKHWEKKSDVLLSELLTVDILGTMFGTGGIKETTRSSSVLYGDYSIFKNYSFMNKEILHCFFDNLAYRLPTQTEIGEKYGMGKTGISKKLSRFYDKLREEEMPD